MDTVYMGIALEKAKEAALCGEVPVGAVVVYDDRVVGEGSNQREAFQDPTAHAEILALKDAAERLGRWRLEGCTLYVTLEPCVMCVGAIIQARIPRLVFGCLDPKGGAVESLYRLCNDHRLNHQVEVTRDVRGTECAQVLEEFFADLRVKKRSGEPALTRGRNRRI
jgi:tRNA(adenine34) deaminase